MSVFQMSRYQEQKSVLTGCHRMIIEFTETFQRRTAINNAKQLAENISESFDRALNATQGGHENSEEQNESVEKASGQLQTASAVMQDNITQPQGIRIEWTESFDRMEKLLSVMRDKMGHTEILIEQLGEIQLILDESGFQTNISSLNAIVNAEKTGKRGEFFAAVAEEIRKASKKTQEDIKEILLTVRL